MSFPEDAARVSKISERPWPAAHFVATPGGLTPASAWRALIDASPAEHDAALARFEAVLKACSFDCGCVGVCVTVVGVGSG